MTRRTSPMAQHAQKEVRHEGPSEQRRTQLVENRFSEGVRKSVASNETSIIQPTSVAAATPVVASITIQIDEGWLDLASAEVTLLGSVHYAPRHRHCGGNDAKVTTACVREIP